MRHYGYDFIKSSGSDYSIRPAVEWIFFVGAPILLPLAILLPKHASGIFASFLLLLFIYAVLSILAEIIPKLAYYISCMFSFVTTCVFFFFSVLSLVKTKKSFSEFSAFILLSIFFGGIYWISTKLLIKQVQR